MDRLLDRGLVGLAALLALLAAAVLVRGTSRPAVEPPIPLPGRSADVPKENPPARPVPTAPIAPLPPDLVARPDGLRMADLVVGTVDPPAEDGHVVVLEYTGFLADGTVFDSSYKRAEPARYVLGKKRLIPGLDQGLRGMRGGGVRQVEIPPALGFGPRGLPGRVPPAATLLYDLEVLRVIDVPETPAEVPADAWRELAGLRVADLAVGDGPGIAVGHRVRIDHVGWVRGGPRIESSYEQPAPFTFVWGQDQLKWEDAFEGMRVGGRRQLVVPPELGFGEKGRPPEIPPGATLVYQVELVAVE